MSILAGHFILKLHCKVQLKTLTKSRAIVFHASLENARVEEFIGTSASDHVLCAVREVLFKQSIQHVRLWSVFEILLILVSPLDRE